MTVDVNDFEIENDGSMESAVTPGAYCSYTSRPPRITTAELASRPDHLVGRRSYRSRIDTLRQRARRPAVCGPRNALELPPEVREMNASGGRRVDWRRDHALSATPTPIPPRAQAQIGCTVR